MSTLYDELPSSQTTGPNAYIPFGRQGRAGTRIAEVPPHGKSSRGALFVVPWGGGTMAPKEEAVENLRTTQTETRLEAVEAELAEVRRTLELQRSAEDWYAAEAMNDTLATFLLDKIVREEEIEIVTLDANIAPPTGWLAIGLLWRAHLVERFGERFVPTEFGQKAINTLRSEMSGRQQSGEVDH